MNYKNSISLEIFIFRQFYTANKNSPELKVKDIEGGDYFAACFDYEWYRVDIYDTNRLGEAVQVC